MSSGQHRARNGAGFFDGLVIDNFAGGGGASIGIERAIGRAVDYAINHDPDAVAFHRVNHPRTLHYCEDVWSVDPVEVTRGLHVDLAWFSPDCKHHSRAKGGKPVEKKIRGLAWVVIRWAAKVKPSVIMLENVREFETWGPLTKVYDENGNPKLGRDGRPLTIPCKKRAGLTFRRWVGTLRNLGYEVEWRHLNAADFGAPTHRRRLFLVARCDGLPITWPSPTHGPGRRKPWRTAAECIDWSLPCPSIFLTPEEAKPLGVRRPLAEKTMRRIAMGVKRYVLDNPKPFIVQVNHGGDEFRGQSIDEPLSTITGRHGRGVVAPFLTTQFGERHGQDPRSHSVESPIPTITPRVGGGFPLIAPSLIQYNEEKGSESRGQSLGRPLNTIPTANRFGLVATFLAKHYGGVVGHTLDRPLGTVTAIDHHSLVAANITRSNFGEKTSDAVGEPARTITAQGNHLNLVYSYLSKYYGNGSGQTLSEPLHTITARDHFGLVRVQGQDYMIADIGLRMLSPRELFLCQGFPADYTIDMKIKGRPFPKDSQVKMCGNSVSPMVAEALVTANMGHIRETRKPRRKLVTA